MKKIIPLLSGILFMCHLIYSQEDCANALELTFEEYSTCGQIAITNANLTGAVPSLDLPFPECGNFSEITNDLWYYLTVPEDVTELAFHVINAPAPMPLGEYHHQPGLAIYSGECGNLTLLNCFFEEGNIINNGEIRFEIISGLTPGEIIFLRVWDMNNFAVPFFIAASVRTEITEHSCETPSVLSGGGCNILAPKGTIDPPQDCGWNSSNNTVYYSFTIEPEDFQPVHFQASYVLCMDNEGGPYLYPQNTELQIAIYSWNGVDCTGIGGSPNSTPPNNTTYQTCSNGTGLIVFYKFLAPGNYIIAIDGYQDISGTSLCTFDLEINVITELTCPNDTTVCSDSDPFMINPQPAYGVNCYGEGYSNGSFNPSVVTSDTSFLHFIYSSYISCDFNIIVINSEEPLPETQICLVTVNENNKCEILWEKPITNNIDYFNIYKESGIGNVYEIIGTVDYNSLSTFIDENSEPQTQSYSYKIAGYSICGFESELSNYHQTVWLNMTEQTDSWHLSWTPYIGVDEFTINVLRGTSPDDLEIIASFGSEVTEFTDNDPPFGYVYYQIEVVLSTPCDVGKSTSILYSNIATNNPNYYNPVGIDDYNITNSIFPNPTSTSFTIKSENFPENVQIFDLNGKLVKSIHDYSGEDIDISDVQSGVYFVKIINKDSVSTGKLVVK